MLDVRSMEGSGVIVARPPRRTSRVSRVPSASRFHYPLAPDQAASCRVRPAHPCRRLHPQACTGHLAAHLRISRLELHGFDHLLIRHELDEATVVRIGVRTRLAGPGRRVVGERNAERTTFASVERVYVARHATRD